MAKGRGRGRGRSREVKTATPGGGGGDVPQTSGVRGKPGLDIPAPSVPLVSTKIPSELIENPLTETFSSMSLDSCSDSAVDCPSPFDQDGDSGRFNDSLSMSDVPDAVILAAKPNYGMEGERVQLTSNVFEMRGTSAGCFYRYHVLVEQSMGGETKRDLTKGASNEYFLCKKRELCYAVLTTAVARYPAVFGPNPKEYAYDRRNTLYTKNQPDIPMGGGWNCQVSLGDERVVEADNDLFNVTISLTDQDPISLADLSGVTTLNLDERDRSLTQMVEVITSQIVYNNPNYVALGGAKFMQREGVGVEVDLGSGRVMGDGFTKSCKVIEGSGTEPVMAMTLAGKKCALQKAQAVLKTLAETLKRDQVPQKLNAYQIDTFNKDMKGVSVKNKVNNRELIVHHVNTEGALDQTKLFKDKRNGIERRLSIAQYYQTKLNIQLRYPNLPLLVEASRNGFVFHPIEFCDVLPHQTVPLHKHNPDMTQNMIRKSALKPSDNLADLQQKVKETGVLNNANLKAMGVETRMSPMSVVGRVKQKPQIQYSNNANVTPNEQGNWDQRNRRFAESGSCTKWAAVCMDPQAEGKILGEFMRLLEEGAKASGVSLGKRVTETNSTKDILETTFKTMAREGVEFIFFFLPTNGMDRMIKDLMKLYERRYEILTQCVKMGVARSVVTDPQRKGRQSLSNILAKTNMKLGGLNYGIIVPPKIRKYLFDGKTMLIGCDVNHPPPQPASDRGKPPREPSVVGFVANGPKRPLLMTGEFAFQAPRKEMAETQEKLMGLFIERWLSQSSGKKLPEQVIYFRDGVSDGQFKQVILEEVGPMKAAFRKAVGGNADLIPKFTVVVCRKRHHERLFQDIKKLKPSDNAMRQDIPVGTVVDTGIVQPHQWEFFGKFHQALQGTAKPLKVNVVLDEIGFSQDDMEDLCNDLAYDHQIVTKPVSLPSPVFGAHNMAERGKRLWRAFAYLESDGSSIARSSDSGISEERDWAAISDQLQVSGTKLQDRQHWA